MKTKINLTKADKETILSGLIHQKFENFLILQELRKDMTDDSYSFVEAEMRIKTNEVFIYYAKRDKRIKKMMIEFGYKDDEENPDWADDNSYEEARKDSEYENLKYEGFDD